MTKKKIPKSRSAQSLPGTSTEAPPTGQNVIQTNIESSSKAQPVGLRDDGQ